jgi:hypothetical protein
VVQGLLHTPIHGSRALFLLAGALNLASMTSMGILLATLTRSMAQFTLDSARAVSHHIGADGMNHHGAGS